MTKPTEKETKWFVKRLIELRSKLDGYHTPINFKLQDLYEWEKENGINLPKAEIEDRAIWMLEEIKKHYIENNNNPLFAESLKTNGPVGGKITIDGYTTKMLSAYKNWLDLSPEARLVVNIKPIEKIPAIKFTTGGKNFELNINDGSFEFGNVKDSFGTKTQEFKILRCLVESRNSLVGYQIICSCLGFKDSTTSRHRLTTVLKRIKHKMGILPKRRVANPDIFKNITNSGYEILED